MPTELFSNAPVTTLAANVGASDTTLVMATGEGFPTAVPGVSQFRVLVESEILIVTATSGPTFTVTRGAEDTTAAEHNAATVVTHIVTAGSLLNLRTAGRLLFGDGPPASGSGLEALDGISDPWRWWSTFSGWVGPAYAVTWLTGDAVPVPTLPAGAGSLYVLIGPGASPDAVNSGAGFAAFGNSSIGDTASDPLVAAADGAGVAFLVQIEVDSTHTVVPEPAVDITTMLGDVTVGAPSVWGETGDGNDGDGWIDTSTGEMYGPKTAGAWGPARWVLPPA
jgi:hypothetical protein